MISEMLVAGGASILNGERKLAEELRKNSIRTHKLSRSLFFNTSKKCMQLLILWMENNAKTNNA